MIYKTDLIKTLRLLISTEGDVRDALSLIDDRLAAVHSGRCEAYEKALKLVLKTEFNSKTSIDLTSHVEISSNSAKRTSLQANDSGK